MYKNKMILIFTALAIVQLLVPASMIYEKEMVISDGKEFRFRTAPIDPSDPFRGKYIVLDFRENRVRIDTTKSWDNRNVFAFISTDRKGFAKIDSVTTVKPEGGNYVKVSRSYRFDDELRVTFPFNRFYMEESKAPIAETAYAEIALDTNQVSYAIVSILDGEAVVKDVVIDGVPVKELIEKIQNKK